MSIKKTTILISLLTLMGWFASPIGAQEDPLKDYADTCRDLKLCFYPSTLRMINLSNNPDLDELVSGVEKLLIYNLDSAARAGKSYKGLIETYSELGYEEYISAYGAGPNFFIYGKEGKKNNQYIGIIEQPESVSVFYLKGFVALNKFPDLINSMNEGDFINPFDFNISDFGESTQDQ
jgi:hypothetical protein